MDAEEDGPTRNRVALAAAACVLLRSKAADVGPGRRQAAAAAAASGAVRERLLAHAWDAIFGGLSGAVLPEATAWAAPAASRLLVDRPQAFFGAAAHPGALTALAAAAAARPPGDAGRVAAQVLVLLATCTAAAGDAALQQQWVAAMRGGAGAGGEAPHKSARGALEFMRDHSQDEGERAEAAAALGVLAAAAASGAAEQGRDGGAGGAGGAGGRRRRRRGPVALLLSVRGVLVVAAAGAAAYAAKQGRLWPPRFWERSLTRQPASEAPPGAPLRINLF
jgi:hypothetical protein